MNAPTCPDCGLYISDMTTHRCLMPVLLEAIGPVALTDDERRTVQWLAGCERCTVDNLAAMFAKVREHERTGR